MKSFNVSEARAAIACPRIFYFDQERNRRSPNAAKKITRIWVGDAAAGSACGTLFHNTVERFNKRAAHAPEIRAALAAAATGPNSAETLFGALKRFINLNCLNRELLAEKSVPQTLAFIAALDTYVRDLAEVLAYAVCNGKLVAEVLEEFFGDTRKGVDVTFDFGDDSEPVRIRGNLDYIYFDWRNGRERILDYKLMPADEPSKDLLQVSLYALMHHQQHRTEPDVAVHYLHPSKAIAGHDWAHVHKVRGVVYRLLQSMAQWQDYSEQSGVGLKPPGSPSLCEVCPWNRHNQCEKRLGPKLEGGHAAEWKESSTGRPEPEVAVQQPPDPGPEVEFEEPEEGESRTADEPSQSAENLQLGKTFGAGKSVGPPLSILPTHVAVVGAAGSGKTWLAKVIAEECVLNGVPILAVDPQGDLVQFLKPATTDAGWTAEELRARQEFFDRVEPRIWTPGSSHAKRLCLSPLRLPTENELAGFENPERRREEWDSLLGVAAGNLVRLADAGGDEELQQTFLLELLRALSRSPGRRLELSDIAAAIGAPDTLGVDDADSILPKSQREKLRQRINSRLRGATANLFQGGTSLDLDALVQPAAASKTPLNVIYLNALPDDAQKQFFVAALAAEVYRWMITSASSGKTRLLFYLDEARDYLPAGTAKPPAKPPLLRLFAQGRKFGVACLICTQSPRSVDYNVFSNASTKFIGRLEAAQDMERVAEWFAAGGAKPNWLSGRTGAPKGSWIGRWPEISSELDGAEFRSRRLYSLHEGAWSPERVEREWTGRD